MNPQTVHISTCFPAAMGTIWDRLQRVDTLQYIAAPYATFKPVDNTLAVWREGETSKYHLKLFGFIYLGVHTISVKQFDKNAYSIYTNEGNNFVPVWNHRIIQQRADNENVCEYSDEVEIYAGWKTPIAALWCKSFYRHRQKKWLKLLKRIEV